MKKFVILSVLLLIVSVVVFYFGWIQIRLDKDMYGILYTKTGGYRSRAAVPGKFSWSWAALIPGNLEIIPMPASSRTIFVSTEKQLPSGNEFSSLMVGSPDFSYRIELFVSYSLGESQAVSLVRDMGLNSDSIDRWYQAVETALTEKALTEIESFTEQRISQNSDGTAASARLNFSDSDLERILARIQPSFPEITLHMIDVTHLRLPDFELYEAARQYYYELTAVKNASLQEEMVLTAQKRADNEVQLDLLKRYGNLFDSFPILIEYIKADPDLRSLQ